MKALVEYRKKRDFHKTSEPLASLKKSKSKLSYVIQEHHASHLHFDFRLEWKGVLKSWAVPKGPSLDPKVRRLAVEVEDHPVKYGSFEGQIPKGEYGGGDVYIWDHGQWEPQGNVDESLKKGRLDFVVKGEKLKGRWALVRTSKQSGKKNQWLLIKRTDEYAISGPKAEAVVEHPDEDEASEAVQQSKVEKGKIDFVEPQLAQLVTTPPVGKDWIHETKFDGYRIQAHLDREKVQLFTRTGQEWSHKYPPIVESLEAIAKKQAVLDGEVVWINDQGQSDFQGLQQALKAHKISRLCYYVFDLLSLDGKDLRKLPLLQRKEILKKLIVSVGEENIRYSDHILGQGKNLFKESCRLEMEGIVSKKAKAPYRSGRSEDWVKSKCIKRQEFVIGGFTDGTGSRLGFGSLLLGIYEEEKFRYVGRVGTGFDQKSLLSLRHRLEKLEQDESPFEVKSPRGKGLHWVSPKLACEVSFSNWTQDRILRVPVFHGLREDKPAKEIHQETAESLSSKVSKEKKRPTKITHPDKIIYEEENLTKKDVIEFYEEVSKFMLPHIKDRPLSLLRCPEGSAGECFFQKHLGPGLSKEIHPLKLKEKSGNKVSMTLDSVEGLLDLAQFGTLEFHAWNCHRKNPMHPDQIVMDFDPDEGIPWKQVCSAALELKDLLEELNLKNFLKVTGGKGLHVHIPFEPKGNWDEIKSFARALADEMVSRNPKKYTATMSKQARKGKIFIDYLRNGYGATAVAPYSLRSKPVSSVAVPIEWDELKKIKSSSEFTLEKTRARLKKMKTDPWADYFKIRQRIGLFQ